jgi:hypothetical protein
MSDKKRGPLELLAQIMAQMALEHSQASKPVRDEADTQTIYTPPPAGL